ncbi:MAG: archaetidylserine decarboxylase [Hydrogenophaga sp.]|jgi:phosphatidylserine decarboxylase|uniref:archaetidylserine decarboxylase n=1 Tax=Hydrogenophaga sp. TaxID=1904254 RepID=UPI00261D0086|nr:archaetidylserine decarboxylase [Hydrogenophaga sp.]MCV0437899.1 archaetidylserine decarboxylase [Hydrogenophaga sp.]
MNISRQLQRLALNEDLNFLLTNRVPRAALTRFMGWFSRIRHPWVRDASMAVWRAFTDLDLSEAKKTSFDSLHDCFVRELRPGLRPIDPRPGVLASPCDAIVGACGRIGSDPGAQVFQAKGFPYPLTDLLGNGARANAMIDTLRGGSYVTLRLTSSMYHRFHAPAALTLEHVTYHSGDTWNVNPIALKRIERLFCKNERAALHARLDDGTPLLLVPVAAILVASMRLRAADVALNAQYRGPHELPCSAGYDKGEEMGWFEHGSTILVFTPPGFALCDDIEAGHRIRMGEALLRRDPP